MNQGVTLVGMWAVVHVSIMIYLRPQGTSVQSFISPFYQHFVCLVKPTVFIFYFLNKKKNKRKKIYSKTFTLFRSSSKARGGKKQQQQQQVFKTSVYTSSEGLDAVPPPADQVWEDSDFLVQFNNEWKKEWRQDRRGQLASKWLWIWMLCADFIIDKEKGHYKQNQT